MKRNKKKVIYIAGPYRSRDEYQVLQNIRAAEARAIMVWQLDAVALCPHMNTRFFGGVPGTTDDTWLEGDLELLSRCDAIWLDSAWKTSSGSMNEKRFAVEHGIECLFTIQELKDYLRREEDEKRAICD